MRAVALRLAAVLVAGVFTGSHGRAQTGTRLFPLNSDAVVAALRVAGVSITPSQVHLPVQITVNSPRPMLIVSGAELLADGRMRVRLVCNPAHECIPFFASIDLGQGNRALKAVASLSSSSHPDLPISTAGRPALRPGEHTVLLMEDDHMRIALPVISIDSGAIGSEVRVSSLDRKRVYRGVVLSSQAVQGDVP